MEDVIERLKQQRREGRKERIEPNSDSLIRTALRKERQAVSGAPVVPVIRQTLQADPRTNPVLYEKGNVVSVNNAYGDSVKLVKEKLRKDSLRVHDALVQVKKGDILVVKGTYDSIEEILDSSKIPYKVSISEKDIAGAQVIFVNCSGSYKNKPVSHLKKFVENGGYLVSTDWALHNLVESMFDNIKYSGNNTNNEVVDVTVPDPDNFYVKNAFPKGIRPAWWLETASHCIETKSKDAKVLIRSDELAEKYGSDIIGVTFRHGKGRVFHFISHFKLQQSKEYLDPSKQNSVNFAKDILDFNDQEINRLGINKQQQYAAVETAYTSAMIIHNIIAAKKMGYNGD
jgi:hypothetical protein